MDIRLITENKGIIMLDHYEHPIYEDGVQLFDKVYLKMEL